jgi:hypothetical protein
MICRFDCIAPAGLFPTAGFQIITEPRSTEERTDTGPNWVRAASPKHGELATHLAAEDKREFAHNADFPLTLVFNLSKHRYGESWYLGVCREMAWVQVFRPVDRVRFSQSPSGGGEGNPAWDFQWFIPDYKVGRRHQLVMRTLYRVHEVNRVNPFESQDHLLRDIQRVQRFETPAH